MLDIHTNDCTQLRVGLINPRAGPKLGYAYYTLRTIIYRGQQLGVNVHILHIPMCISQQT